MAPHKHQSMAKHTHITHIITLRQQQAWIAIQACLARLPAAHIAAKNGYNHDLQMTIITQWTKFMENAFGGVLKYLENDAHTP